MMTETNLIAFLHCILTDVEEFKVIEGVPMNRVPTVIINTKRPLSDRQKEFIGRLIIAPFAFHFGILTEDEDGKPF